MNRKRFFALILCLVILFSLTVPAVAANSEAVQAAEELYARGLFKGTGDNADGTPNFSLDRAPRRDEAVTMLVRLLGKDEEALAGKWNIPFPDVDDWAKPYVGYAYANGLTNGVEGNLFGSERTIDATQYLTLVLRALGYSSETDFKWNAAWELSDKIGLTDGRYTAANNTSFTRGDVAIVSESALHIEFKGTSKTLLSKIRETMPSSDVFVDLLGEFSALHKRKLSNAVTYDDVKQYYVNDTSTANLLTAAEVNEFLKEGETIPETVAYEQAAEDVSVYFRALRSAYGGYYYFSEDAFDAAEEKVMSWLEGKGNVNTADFAEALENSLDFLTDGHFRINNNIVNEDSLRYEYYYCTGQEFEKDDIGYFKYISGEKWYFNNFSDSRVSMELSLNSAGKLMYSPVLFCLADTQTRCAVTLKNENGKTRNEYISWTLSSPYLDHNGEADFNLLEENGIAYVSIRAFDPADANSVLQDYIASGAAVKDADVIIMDIRSNIGGGDSFPRQWIKNYSGTTPQESWLSGQRLSLIREGEWQKIGGGDSVTKPHGTFNITEKDAIFLRNDIPIIVLTDDMCGSSGESARNLFSCMDNVIIVGGNTNGAQLCGNQMNGSLPNSNIPVAFGSSLHGAFTVENVDFKGYEPDVWCNPKTALESVLNMLVRYDIANIDNVFALRAELDGDIINRDYIQLQFGDFLVPVDATLYGRVGTNRFTVLAGGQPAEKYTVTSSDPFVCEIKDLGGGVIEIVSSRTGKTQVTVTCGSKTGTFFWCAE